MARQAQSANSRKDFTLVIDEFADFITPTMAQILTGARKYRLALVLAHQELRQLQRNEEVASAVLSSPFTRICFRVGDEDARKLSDGFSHFEARDLQNLGLGEAIMRVERSDFDFNMVVAPPAIVDEDQASERRKAVIAASRAKYSTPRADIEAAIRKATTAEPTGEKVVAKRAAENKEALPLVTVKLAVPEPKPATVSERKTVPADLGKGCNQHKMIQRRIKEAAEALGFRSTIEKQIPDTKESIDLFLERGDQSIACEISISTTIDHEVGNVAKCLKAGLQKVAVICLDAGRLEAIATAVTGSLGAEAAQRVVYFQPDPFIADLKQMPKPVSSPSETTNEVAGYKIKRRFPKLTSEEQQQKESIANQVAKKALRQKPV